MQTMQTCRPLRKRANTWACSEDFFFSFFGLAIPPFSDRSPQVVLKVFGILYSILSLSLTPYRWVYIVYTVYTVYQKREKIMKNQRQKAKNFKSISKRLCLHPTQQCTPVYMKVLEFESWHADGFWDQTCCWRTLMRYPYKKTCKCSGSQSP